MAAERENDIAGSVGRAAGRLASDKALRRRMFRASAAGVSVAVGSMSRALRTLWHEMTGFLFLCLAVIGGAEVWRKWNTHEPQKLAVAAAFSVMFLYFGVSSFWRARRIKPTTKD